MRCWKTIIFDNGQLSVIWIPCGYNHFAVGCMQHNVMKIPFWSPSPLTGKRNYVEMNSCLYQHYNCSRFSQFSWCIIHMGLQIGALDDRISLSFSQSRTRGVLKQAWWVMHRADLIWCLLATREIILLIKHLPDAPGILLYFESWLDKARVMDRQDKRK